MTVVHGDRHGLLLCGRFLRVRLKTRWWTTLPNCIFILLRSLITERVPLSHMLHNPCSNHTNNSLMFIQSFIQ